MNSKKLLPVYFMVLTLPVFAQQADMSLIPYRQGNLWGYASPDKRIIIQPAYNEANFFYEGYASVKKGDKYGYVNKAGKVVIPFNFYIAKHFRYGYFDNPAKHKTDTVLFAGASQRPDGYEICINTSGVRMPKCPAINESSVEDKSTETVSQKLYSNVKANGDIYDKIIDDYKLGTDGDDNYYIAVKNNLLGVFNNKFEIVVPFVHNLVKKLVIGSTVYLLVEKNGVQGVLNANGSVYIPVENANLYFVKTTAGKEYFVVQHGTEGSLKDTKLNNVFTGNYTNIVYDKDAGFTLTGPDQLRGYYFLNTNVTVAPRFADVKFIPGADIIWVTTATGKGGYINSKGDEFFSE